jgi:hypothetical protein
MGIIIDSSAKVVYGEKSIVHLVNISDIVQCTVNSSINGRWTYITYCSLVLYCFFTND